MPELCKGPSLRNIYQVFHSSLCANAMFFFHPHANICFFSDGRYSQPVASFIGFIRGKSQPRSGLDKSGQRCRDSRP